MELVTEIINGFTIRIPVGLEETMDTPVRDSYQSFLKESTRDVRRHLTCLTTLLPRALTGMGPQVRVHHAFGGLGLSAQIIDQILPDVRHSFWERDPTCVKYLESQYNDVHRVSDSMELLMRPIYPDIEVLLLDMSVATIKTPGIKEVWASISRWMTPDKVIWFTDTACHRIHLNYKTYEKDFGFPVDKTAESYIDAYANWLKTKGMTITMAMREAGECYCIARTSDYPKFLAIPYV